MADVSSAALQAGLLRLQARRLAVVSLIMSSRVEEGAPMATPSAFAVFRYRLRIVLAYAQLRLAIRVCEAMLRGKAR